MLNLAFVAVIALAAFGLALCAAGTAVRLLTLFAQAVQ